MASMMQKAQKMHSDMKLAQDKIKLLSCVGESASGAIKVTINGQHQATAVEIDKNLRSEEHTSELQSRRNLVCRLLLEKKK